MLTAITKVVAAFREELQKLGWEEGRNIQIEYRWYMGDVEKARASAPAAPTTPPTTRRSAPPAAPAPPPRSSATRRRAPRTGTAPSRTARPPAPPPVR